MRRTVQAQDGLAGENGKHTTALRESKTLLDVPRTRTRAGSSASQAGVEEDKDLMKKTRSSSRSSSSPGADKPLPATTTESISSASRRASVTERLSVRSTTSDRLSASTRPRALSNLASVGSSGKLSATSRMTPSPDLPPLDQGLISPLKRGNGKSKAGLLGLGTPEVDQWVQAGRGGGKNGKGKKVGFMDDSDEDDDERGRGTNDNEDATNHDGKKENVNMAVQISPRRPTASTTNWTAVPSPLRHAMPSSSSPSGSSAHDLLRTIVSDVLYDLHRDQKAQLTGMHLDLIRMGRGWKRDLGDVLKELGELREENGRLKEENERLRRGY
jgi:protein NEDD1